MTKPYFVFYYVNGEIFKNTDNKFNGLEKAKRYCEEHSLPTSEIHAFTNESELRYFLQIWCREGYSELQTHPKIELLKTFTNYVGDQIPSLTFEPSMTYRDKDNQWHYILIPKSIFQVNKELINIKILFDYLNKGTAHLEILIEQSKGEFVVWKCNDLEMFKQAKKEIAKVKKGNLKELSESLKYERLLRLRSEGKITKTQSKELYKLEKKWGGNNV